MKKALLTAFLGFFVISVSWAQIDYEKQMPLQKKFDRTIIDTVYGIQHYEPLNVMLNGDSIRMCGTYACQNQVKDFYVTGELLHAGYYTDGQLKTYKNYYPNGNVERDFKAIDLYRSQAKLFYESGKPKSVIKYNEGDPTEWTDYYENGQIEYTEEKGKQGTWVNFQRFYYEDGKPKRLMELVDKKKISYTYTEYYANGQVKVEGAKVYNSDLGDYLNTGTWKYYDESGNLIKEELFDKGQLVKN